MKTQAEALGYKIDTYAAKRPIAYKGPRFDPTAWEYVLTDLEVELLEVLGSAVGGIGYLAECAGTNVDDWKAWEAKARALIAKARA